MWDWSILKLAHSFYQAAPVDRVRNRKPGGATDKCQSRACCEMDVLHTNLHLFHTIEDQAEKSGAPLPCSRKSQITSLLPHVSTIKAGP